MTFRLFLTALAVVLAALPAQAQLLVEENFDYTAATLLTDNGYAAHSGGGTLPLTVVADNLTFPSYPSVSGNRTEITGSGEDVHRVFTAQTSGTVYAAVLVRPESATAGGEYIFHLGSNPISTNFRAKVFVRSASGGFQFGITKSANSGSSVVYGAEVFDEDETVLLVVKYQFNGAASDDVASLYTFDAADAYGTEPGSPDALATDVGTDLNSVASYALRQANAAISADFDGIRVATSWADLFPAPPAATDFTFIAPTASSVYTAGNKLKPIWTTDPVGGAGNVIVTLRKAGVDIVTMYAGPNLEQPNFGAARYTLPYGTVAGSDYTIYVELAADTTVNSESDAFTITAAPVVVATPGEDDVLTAGNATTVTFATNGIPTPQRANLYLQRLGQAGSVRLGVEPGTDGTVEVTIPAETESGGDYYILVRVTGADGETSKGRSGVFEVIGAEPVARPQPTHFVVGAPITEREAWLDVRTDLRDGAEVGVFAGDALVGSALVSGGVAAIAVRGADLEDGQALSLRAFDGVETDLTAVSVREAEGAAAALAFADMAELTVETAKGTTAGTALVVGASPNPTAGVATVRVSEPAAVRVYDALGRQVADLGTVETEARWDASSAAPGVYVVRATGATATTSVRVTVAR